MELEEIAFKLQTSNLLLKQQLLKEKQDLKEEQDLIKIQAKTIQDLKENNQETDNLLSILDSKDDQISSLNLQIIHLKSSLDSLKSRNSVLDSKSSTLEQDNLSLSHSIAIKSQEISQLDQLNQFLIQQQDQNSTLHLQFKQEKNSLISSLSLKVDEFTLENSRLNSRLLILENQSQDLDSSLKSALLKITDLESEKNQSTLQFNIEMNTQKKLADLYNQKAIALTSRNDELQQLADSLEHNQSLNIDRIKQLESSLLEKNNLLDFKIKELENVNNNLSQSFDSVYKSNLAGYLESIRFSRKQTPKKRAINDGNVY